jgi:hypothetical protein
MALVSVLGLVLVASAIYAFLALGSRERARSRRRGDGGSLPAWGDSGSGDDGGADHGGWDGSGDGGGDGGGD